jgi:thymidine kinase
MSKLYFRYGAMNSGKSTALLQVAFNYEERGQTVLIAKPSIDTKDENVFSRLGIKRHVDINVLPDSSILRDFQERLTDIRLAGGDVDCLIVDEAQFFSVAQINELFQIAVILGVPVIAYGIRTDFQTKSFPGSLRLMEIAHSLEEMKTICRCGRKALFNARKVDGVFTSHGDQVAIDGDVAYESLCGTCYIRDVGPVV